MASSKAVDVYAAYESSVYQVKIIEVASGSQNSLGTGFVILDGATLATNYHVVSAKVFEPEKYRIEIQRNDEKIILDIVDIDVVSDLAILKPINSGVLLGKVFQLQTQLPEKGETLYSLGNPHDLGMTVVEGTFNGLVEHRFTEQIHFSGAINSGMSGGPVVSDDAFVVGINVATSGNQIGFLVPVKALVSLIERYQKTIANNILKAASNSPSDSFFDSSQLLKSIASQISNHTSNMINAALDVPWETHAMGKVTVQSADVSWLECWGDSQKNKELKFNSISRGCHSGSNVFLGSQFNSGFIEYEFLYFEAPTWPSYSVYQYLSRDTAGAMPGNRGGKKQLGPYQCVDREVVNSQGLNARVSYCLRAYKKLDNLYDAFFMAVSVDQSHHAVMSHFTLSGVNKPAAQRFLSQFIEVIAWP